METQTINYIDIFNKLNFEKIVDHPNILIAANFWEEERFLAARTCYKFMREIDDLIDNYKSEHAFIELGEQALFISRVNQWINLVKNNTHQDSFQKELIITFDKFRIPLWTMETFAKSMIYDISNNGFSTIEGFLDYSKGASIAPASVFVHLCGIKKSESGYAAPSFNVKNAATPCAIFSYLVHIIRDFQKDQMNNLNYFADDMILKHGLTRLDLWEMASGAKIKDGFRSMIKEYLEFADIYRIKTYEMIQEISPLLEPRYQLSLEIIFNLYLMVFERINAEEGSFSSEELNPTAAEIRERVYKTICGFKEIKQRQFIQV